MPLSSGEKWGAGIGLALATAAGVALATRSSHTSSSPAPSPQAGTVTLGFQPGTGPSGGIPDPHGGRLTDLVLVVANGMSQAQTVVLSAPIQPVGGSTYSGGRWFAYAGQPGVTYLHPTATGASPDVSVTVPPGGQVAIRFGTTWSGNAGTYETVVNWTVGGQSMPQAVDSQTWTITPVAAASVGLPAFSGGPSGNYGGTIGSTVEFGAGGSNPPANPPVPSLQTTWSNSGGQDATITPTVIAVTDPQGQNTFGSPWYAVAINGQPITPTQNPSVKVPAGGQVTVSWNAAWTFEQADAGLTFQAKVSW